MWSRKTIGDGIEKMKGSLSPSEQEKKARRSERGEEQMVLTRQGRTFVDLETANTLQIGMGLLQLGN